MSSVRRRIAATFAATALLALSACGFDAQTNQQYQAAVGANSHGDVDVLNALLVANPDGSATVSAAFLNKSGDEQSLSSVTVATMTDETLPVSELETELPLPVSVLTNLGFASDAGGFVVTEGAEAGYYVKVTFSFSDAAPVTMELPVVARTAEYEKVAGGGELPEDTETE